MDLIAIASQHAIVRQSDLTRASLNDLITCAPWLLDAGALGERLGQAPVHPQDVLITLRMVMASAEDPFPLQMEALPT